MIESLSRGSNSGDLYINQSRLLLDRHEWGKALIAVEKGFTKGNLSDAAQAENLRTQIKSILGFGDAGGYRH